MQIWLYTIPSNYWICLHFYTLNWVIFYIKLDKCSPVFMCCCNCNYVGSLSFIYLYTGIKFNLFDKILFISLFSHLKILITIIITQKKSPIVNIVWFNYWLFSLLCHHIKLLKLGTHHSFASRRVPEMMLWFPVFLFVPAFSICHVCTFPFLGLLGTQLWINIFDLVYL